LKHPEPYVRYWAIRFLGDARCVSPKTLAALEGLAQTEQNPSVLGQLAASAKRLPGDACLAVVNKMIDRQAAADDARVPWLVWWAIESKAMTAVPQLLKAFSPVEGWANAMRRDNALRLLRRWSGEGTAAGYDACDALLSAAPEQFKPAALEAVRQGLAERSQGLVEITQGGLFGQVAQEASAELKHARREFVPLEGKLKDHLVTLWQAEPGSDVLLELALQAGDERAYAALIQQLSKASGKLPIGRALHLLQQFGREDVVPLLLPSVNDKTPEGQLGEVLDILARYDRPEVMTKLMQEYADLSASERRLVRDVLLSRAGSALAFLRRIERGEFPLTEVSLDELRKLSVLNNDEINALVHKLWGAVGPGTPEEKLAAMRRFNNDLHAAPGDAARGKTVFMNKCGVCHTLHGEGTKVGPDLTTANRQDVAALLANIVDPSAVIRREFVVNVVLTVGGRTVTGILAEQDGASVTLLTAENKRVTLPRDDIAEMHESNVSLMPEGLLDSISTQDRRDLFSYLQK
jgi:putative heme-binding domain-containing protein